MATHVQHYIRPEDPVHASQRTDLVWIGDHCTIGIQDADTAERLARAFYQLAERMREEAKLPEPVEVGS